MRDLEWDKIGYPAQSTRVTRTRNPVDAPCPAWRRQAATRIELKLESRKRETKLEGMRRWRKANREKMREYQRKYRTRKAASAANAMRERREGAAA